MAAADGGAIINIGSGAAVSPDFGRASYTTTKRALEAMSESLASDLKGSGVSVNCLRLELSVWSEGYAFTLGEQAKQMDFEDPIIMSDACLWMVAQGPDWTGRIVTTIADLRKYGAVRPRTRMTLRRLTTRPVPPLPLRRGGAAASPVPRSPFGGGAAAGLLGWPPPARRC